MRFCLILLTVLFSFVLAVNGYCETVDVKISGINEEMTQNVMLLLSAGRVLQREHLEKTDVMRQYKKAPEQIRRALIPFGYYHAEVESTFEKNSTGWLVTFHVDPGSPVIVKDINIVLEGEGKNDPVLTDVIDKLKAYEGKILLQNKYENGKKAFLKVAYSNGYLESKYKKSVIEVNREKNIASIQMVMDTGTLFHFGEISSNQNVLTQSTLDKFNDLKPGDPYKENRLVSLQRLLYKTNYFKHVLVKGMVEDARDSMVPVVIEVEPLEYWNKYDIGLGFATDIGFNAKIRWENRLLNRHGHRINSFFKIAEKESELAAFYNIPVFNPQYDKQVFGATVTNESWHDTKTTLLSVGSALSHDGPMFKYGFSLEGRKEIYTVGKSDDDSFLIMPSFNWGMLLADDLQKPQTGLRVTVNLRGASKDALSDISFLQGDVGVKGLISPTEKWHITGKVTVAATWVDDIEDLPPSLRYYAGGDQTVRGYSYKSIAPVNSSGVKIGGKYLLTESVEVERDITGLWSLAAFYDVSRVTNSFDAMDKKEGVGIGVRVRLPFGHIRFDVACGISDEDHPFRVHFMVGGKL